MKQLWEEIDGLEESGELQETEQEAEEYDQEVREEINERLSVTACDNPITIAPTPSIPNPVTPAPVETLQHIPSPIDTPGEGRGIRDDPASPLPLGHNALASKKEYQTLTKHFEQFTKQSAKQKNTSGLGAKVFQGLRFCLPPELGATSKQKQWWGVVSSILGHAHADSLSRGSSHTPTRHCHHARHPQFWTLGPALC